MTRKLPQSRQKARKALGAELRRLRVLAGISGGAMAQIVGKSASSISLIESGDRAITPEQVQAWLGAVLSAVPDALSADDTTELERLTGDATDEISPLSGTLAARQVTVAKLEKAATTAIRNWQPSFVPGLLQTRDYARAVFSMIKPPGDAEDAVRERITRQAILGDSSRQLEFVMAEQALGWRPDGPDPRPAQLDRIASLAALPHVAVRVIPVGAVMYVPPMTPFTVYEGDETLVAIELLHRRIDTTDVKEYLADLDALRRSALSGDEAIAFIRELAGRIAP